jgi:hypothetical protein
VPPRIEKLTPFDDRVWVLDPNVKVAVAVFV